MHPLFFPGLKRLTAILINHVSFSPADYSPGAPDPVRLVTSLRFHLPTRTAVILPQGAAALRHAPWSLRWSSGATCTCKDRLVGQPMADDINVLYMRSALRWHLFEYRQLAMAAHSCGKNLHGWFKSTAQIEETLESFMQYAVQMGADKRTWQMVRMQVGSDFLVKIQPCISGVAGALICRSPVALFSRYALWASSHEQEESL